MVTRLSAEYDDASERHLSSSIYGKSVLKDEDDFGDGERTLSSARTTEEKKTDAKDPHVAVHLWNMHPPIIIIPIRLQTQGCSRLITRKREKLVDCREDYNCFF